MTALETANLTLQQVVDQMGDDIGKLIGEQVECTVDWAGITSPEDFSKQLEGSVVLAKFELGGDYSGESFLVTGVRTAISLGGRLIMLPAHELAERVETNNFEGELTDAFDEISNIVTGALNSVFVKGVPRKIHFKKQTIKLEGQPFAPPGVIPGMAAGHYHLTAAAITVAGENIGAFWFLLPIAALKLEKSATTETPAAAQAKKKPSTSSAGPELDGAPPLILVVADEPGERERVAALLADKNLQVLQAGVQEDLREVLGGRDVAGALLIMREVGDLGFAAAIKLRSVIKPATPLIAAGPAWTKKAVLQAIKYGACDILITPVSAEELFEKLRGQKS
jgi:CheY-like chemotaxis protein